jgi:hypothetical protein
MFGDERYAPGIGHCDYCNKGFRGHFLNRVCPDCRAELNKYHAAYDAWLAERQRVADEQRSVNNQSGESSMTADQVCLIKAAIDECEAVARFIRSQTPETLRAWAKQMEAGIALEAVGLDRAVGNLREAVENRLDAVSIVQSNSGGSGT